MYGRLLFSFHTNISMDYSVVTICEKNDHVVRYKIRCLSARHEIEKEIGCLKISMWLSYRSSDMKKIQRTSLKVFENHCMEFHLIRTNSLGSFMVTVQYTKYS